MPDEEVTVERVEARKTQSGNTRFVLVDDSGRQFTTFKEPIARQALAAEGKRAKITYHEQQKDQFTRRLPGRSRTAAGRGARRRARRRDRLAHGDRGGALHPGRRRGRARSSAGGAVREGQTTEGPRRGGHPRGRLAS